VEAGPHDGSLRVLTFREGVAARVGHDLVLEVTRWRAAAGSAAGTGELSADPRSLEVREGRGGVKPLTDGDRAQIGRTIDDKVLRGQAIEYRAAAIRREGDALAVEGELSLGGRTRPLDVRLAVRGARLAGRVTLRQSDWGITPYRGMMGALRVRDEVEVEVDLPAPR